AVIVGSELQTDQGDIIGLFLDDEVRGHGALEVIDEIKNQGGLAILPHPFRDRELNNAILKELFGRVDAIEALNSRIPVRKQMTEHSKKAGKPLVAGSDAHFPCEIGLCRTIIRVENNSLEEIRKAILTKDIKIIGKQGPPYLHSLSAIIRNIKTKKYRKLPASIAVLARDYSRALISPLLCNLQGFI
ncbi:MAG: PHP-associated domain-containing protein, partial [Candidatus Hodarchaeota archaeon]